ncbi:unnamed protein product [Allacma fusca]|uniref:Uncharacterized protein n=1 Tax=Allacma fusca TaxID=39272 RepID=A0A8J2NZJ9_9HEXA|nr:unnamed protein product [Allacma fusca]
MGAKEGVEVFSVGSLLKVFGFFVSFPGFGVVGGVVGVGVVRAVLDCNRWRILDFLRDRIDRLDAVLEAARALWRAVREPFIVREDLQDEFFHVESIGDGSGFSSGDEVAGVGGMVDGGGFKARNEGGGVGEFRDDNGFVGVGVLSAAAEDGDPDEEGDWRVGQFERPHTKSVTRGGIPLPL